MKITNTLDKIKTVYKNGEFNFNKWEEYVNSIYPNFAQLFIEDMNQTLKTGLFSYEKDYLPLLNAVSRKTKAMEQALNSFNKATDNLERKIIERFGKSIDVEIIFYLGLLNGAGWVLDYNNKTLCLLGIEKIIELDWCDEKSMIGLIYHELGHVYQGQYGVLEREFESRKERFLWQLFTEGIANYFEQILVGDFEYYHCGDKEWKIWCDDNLDRIKKDFYNDLPQMTFENQRYFGDWVFYENHSDVGYYLGTKFVQFICINKNFNEILSLDIKTVTILYEKFLNEKTV